jgi:hypothetical protein
LVDARTALAAQAGQAVLTSDRLADLATRGDTLTQENNLLLQRQATLESELSGYRIVTGATGT